MSTKHSVNSILEISKEIKRSITESQAERILSKLSESHTSSDVILLICEELGYQDEH